MKYSFAFHILFCCCCFFVVFFFKTNIHKLHKGNKGNLFDLLFLKIKIKYLLKIVLIFQQGPYMSKPKKGTDNSKSATTGIVYISFNFNSIIKHYFNFNFNFRFLTFVVQLLFLPICYAVRTTTYETESGEVETVQDYTMTGGDVTQERMSNHPASSKGRVRIQPSK